MLRPSRPGWAPVLRGRDEQRFGYADLGVAGRLDSQGVGHDGGDGLRCDRVLPDSGLDPRSVDQERDLRVVGMRRTVARSGEEGNHQVKWLGHHHDVPAAVWMEGLANLLADQVALA